MKKTKGLEMLMIDGYLFALHVFIQCPQLIVQIGSTLAHVDQNI
jgi:hypothetical protein